MFFVLIMLLLLVLFVMCSVMWRLVLVCRLFLMMLVGCCVVMMRWMLRDWLCWVMLIILFMNLGIFLVSVVNLLIMSIRVGGVCGLLVCFSLRMFLVFFWLNRCFW